MAKKGSRLNVFQERLELYRHNDRAEAILLVAQDKHLVRILLAWEKILVRRKRRLSEFPDCASEHGHWDWLWENISYSIEDLVAVSGLSMELVEKNMAVLRGNRLILPDGTINKYAAQYLRTKVLGLFRAKGVGSPAAKSIAKEPNN